MLDKRREQIVLAGIHWLWFGYFLRTLVQTALGIGSVLGNSRSVSV